MKYLALTILVVSCIMSCSSKNGTNELAHAVKLALEHWPTTAWAYDTLVQAPQFKYVTDSFPGTYSLLIVNNGKIVCEYYQEPYAKDSLIHINSCTKTVISILFGTVFKEELAHHENMAAINYFPEYTDHDSRIQQIKVKHFLSMSSGLNWNGGIDAADVIHMSNTNDWAKYVFERTVSGPPGENFHYNSGGSQVISSILNKQTTDGLLVFAKEHVFHPLGISDMKWDCTRESNHPIFIHALPLRNFDQHL